MPTYAEVQEFVEKCKFTYDKASKMITATGPNGNSIQIAEASIRVGIGTDSFTSQQGAAVAPGFWSSTLDDLNSHDAALFSISVSSGNVTANVLPRMNRCFGLPVRPVSIK